jgi:hypothetical protein
MNKLSLLALTACFEKEDSGLDETGMDDTAEDTGWTYYPTEIDVVTYSYDASEWFYSVDIIGWAENVTMYITQDTSSPWEEDHELENIEYADDGSWDLWELTLPITTEWDQQESGVNSLFAGDAAMEATMAWRIEAYEDGAVADCVVWGSDTSLVDTGDCRVITF